MIAIHVIVGMLGLTLTWLVLKEQDWMSTPFSTYRHTQFLFASIGSVGWSYCLLGFTRADPDVSIAIGVSISISLIIYTIYGGKTIATSLCRLISRYK